MFGALTGSVDTESPPRGVGKPLFQINGAHGLQYPDEIKWHMNHGAVSPHDAPLSCGLCFYLFCFLILLFIHLIIWFLLWYGLLISS